TMIVALDQFLWRPVVVLAQRFRVEDSGATEEATSWFLNLLKRSRVVGFVRGVAGLLAPRRGSPKSPKEVAKSGKIAAVVSTAFFVILLAVLATGAWKLVVLLHHVPFAQWRRISWDSLLTLARVLAALALGTLWAVPAGLAIGLSPRLSRFLQPVVQVAASFPAPMLFPVAILVMKAAGISLGFGSVVLMLLGTQWYILFNVIAGAMAIPADLREVARSYRFGAWQRFRRLYLPAVFPHLVTGWVTAGGGAWNASIVAEYVTFRGEVNAAEGIGSRISEAAARADFGSLAASILVMSTVVVLFNRAVWRRCYHFAETRYSLGK
ncbi:MAG: ABC transporter permease subunit, partial [Planctomycetes bacterium]|nr:ABC transporter permease subunit [Planctomycetota bacterium]